MTSLLVRSLAVVAGVLIVALALGLARAQERGAPSPGFCASPGALNARLGRTHTRVIVMLNRNNRLIEFWVKDGGGWLITTYTPSRGLACIFDKGDFSKVVETARAPGLEAAE